MDMHMEGFKTIFSDSSSVDCIVLFFSSWKLHSKVNTKHSHSSFFSLIVSSLFPFLSLFQRVCYILTFIYLLFVCVSFLVLSFFLFPFSSFFLSLFSFVHWFECEFNILSLSQKKKKVKFSIALWGISLLAFCTEGLTCARREGIASLFSKFNIKMTSCCPQNEILVAVMKSLIEIKISFLDICYISRFL